MAEPKAKVSAKEVVTDLRAGLTDLEIMRKYDLSPKGLQSLFGKLVDKGVMEQRELDGRKSPVRVLDSEKPSGPKTDKPATGPDNSFRCASCGLPQPEDSDECPRCGIVHNKADEGPMRPGPIPGPPAGGVHREAPIQGRSMGVPTRVEPSPMDTAMIVGVLGSALLLLGCFSPVVRVPMLGGINLFSVGQISTSAQIVGYVLVGVAVAGLVFSVTRRYGYLWQCGASATGLVLVAFVVFWRKISVAKAGMAQAMGQFKTQIPGGPADQAAQQLSAAMTQVIQIGMGWGWAPLLAGAALLVVAFFLAPDDSRDW